MSSAFAIAAVTAVIRDLLNDGLNNRNLSAVGIVNVTSLPPDRIPTTNSEERSQINLFLYHATPNIGWRNVGLPSRDSRGGRLTNPPLALDLHYLVTAYGAEEFHAETLLGYAMQQLHENPVLTRAAINTTLKPSLPRGVSLPPGLAMLATADLADQVEQIKIIPQALSVEEMHKLWMSFQSHYRPTAAYQVSVVLIESNKATRSPLPVLTRGKDDSGVTSQADLIPPFPTIEQIILPNNQISIRPAEEIRIAGHDFAGEDGVKANVTVTVRFESRRLETPRELVVLAANRADDEIKLNLPNDPANFPAGFYTLSVKVTPNGKPDETRSTNELPLQVAPRITAGLGEIRRTNVQNDLGDAEINLTCVPHVKPEQRVSLVLGNRELQAEPRTATVGSLTFKAKGIRAGEYRVRLRVDGVDSLLVDRANKKLPKFDESQKLTIV